MTNRWQYWCCKKGLTTLGPCKGWAGEYANPHLHKWWVRKPATCANGVACTHAHMLLQLAQNLPLALPPTPLPTQLPLAGPQNWKNWGQLLYKLWCVLWHLFFHFIWWVVALRKQQLLCCYSSWNGSLQWSLLLSKALWKSM